MKNLFKVLGTQSLRLCAIALVAVIGFSLTACGDDGGDGGGGDVSAGTWKQTSTLDGSTPEYTLVLGDSGGAWELTKTNNPNATASGTSWKLDNKGLDSGTGKPSIMLMGGSDPMNLPYEKSGAKLKITGCTSLFFADVKGEYTKQ